MSKDSERLYSPQRSRLTNQMHAKLFDLLLPKTEIQISDYQVKLMNWGIILPSFWGNVEHVHSFYELCYVYSGKGEFTFGDTTKQLSEGEAFITRPNDVHQANTSKHSKLGIYCVCFAIKHKPSNNSDKLGTKLIKSFIESKTCLAKIPSLQPVCELISNELTNREFGYGDSLKGLFTKLMHDVFRGFSSKNKSLMATSKMTTGRDEVRIKHALKFIEDNYRRPISVNDVAGQVFISDRHLSRLFRKISGKSILNYITELRLGAAMHMLSNESSSIKSIALQCGFSDVRYFITRFGAFTGMTPTKFREANKK